MTHMNALQGVDMLVNGLNRGVSAIGRRRAPRYTNAADLSRLAGATVANLRRQQAADRERRPRIEVMQQHLLWLKSVKRG